MSAADYLTCPAGGYTWQGKYPMPSWISDRRHRAMNPSGAEFKHEWSVIMHDDLSDFQVLFGQNLGRHVIITFSNGKNISGKVKAANGSFVELEDPNLHVSYSHIGYFEFSKSDPQGWNRFPGEA
jgi:hypothetical protein